MSDSNSSTSGNHHPLISVITAVYNGQATLQRCINSVSGQGYAHKEHIIMDGGSTDGALEILKANDDKIACWKSEPDRGIYHAWNRALPHARGDWICFLGADDFFWDPTVLTRIAPHLQAAAGNTRVIYGKIGHIDAAGHVKAFWGRPWPQERRRFMQGILRVPHPGLFHHRSLFDETGPFCDDYKQAGDYELLLRELKHGEAVHVSDFPVAGMQVGGTTWDMKNRFRGFRETLHARRLHGVHCIPWALGWAWTKNLMLWGLQCSVGQRISGRIRVALKDMRAEKHDDDYTVW